MNGNIKRRITKAEQKLNMEQGPLVVNVTHYASGPLPPDIRQGNMLIYTSCALSSPRQRT